MDTYGYSGVLLADRLVSEVTNMSDVHTAVPHGCDNGALTDRFGVLIQGLLAIVAFSTLMCEYLKCVTVRVFVSVCVRACVCVCTTRKGSHARL